MELCGPLPCSYVLVTRLCIFLLFCSSTLAEAHPASYSKGTERGPFPRSTAWPGHDTDHSPDLLLRSRTSRCCTSCPSMCLHGVQQDSFTLLDPILRHFHNLFLKVHFYIILSSIPMFCKLFLPSGLQLKFCIYFSSMHRWSF
jgi:hypothetical protein